MGSFSVGKRREKVSMFLKRVSIDGIFLSLLFH